MRITLGTLRPTLQAGPLLPSRSGARIRACMNATVQTPMFEAALGKRLGERLEAESSQSLRRRVDELTAANTRYHSENLELNSQLDAGRAQLLDTEDDLAATRTGLRRMIKGQSQQIQAEP
jgi:hypothetical protein